MAKKEKMGNVPNLRFPGFEGKWDEQSLGELAEISSGGTPSRTTPAFWGGKIPWITTSLINFNVIKEANEFITAQGVKGSSAKLFPKNTILMAMYGQGKTRGQVAILDIEATTNQACAAIMPKSSLIDYSFLFQNLSKRYDEIRDLSNQGGQQNLSGGIIKRLTILFPSLKEQKKIAGLISKIDLRIDTQSKIIEELKSLKSLISKKIFAQKLKFNSENNLPPWQVRKLKELCVIVGGGTPKTNKSDYWNGNIQWFTPTEIKQNFVSKSERTITQLGLKNSSAKILPKGAILLTTRATIGEVAIVQEECSTNQGFQSLIVKEGFDNYFLFSWLKENKFELTKRANGSTFPEISKSEIEKIPVTIPEYADQSKIGDFLSKIDMRIDIEERLLKKLEQQKKYLLSNLFI